MSKCANAPNALFHYLSDCFSNYHSYLLQQVLSYDIYYYYINHTFIVSFHYVHNVFIISVKSP